MALNNISQQAKKMQRISLLHCLMLASLLFSQLSLALHHHDHDIQHQSAEHECGVCSQLNSQEDSLPTSQLVFVSSQDSSFHHFPLSLPIFTAKIITAQPRAPPAQ